MDDPAFYNDRNCYISYQRSKDIKDNSLVIHEHMKSKVSSPYKKKLVHETETDSKSYVVC